MQLVLTFMQQMNNNSIFIDFSSQISMGIFNVIIGLRQRGGGGGSTDVYHPPSAIRMIWRPKLSKPSLFRTHAAHTHTHTHTHTRIHTHTNTQHTHTCMQANTLTHSHIITYRDIRKCVCHAM